MSASNNSAEALARVTSPAKRPAPSPPIDPSKLNQQPALLPLPINAQETTPSNTTSQPLSPPLRPTPVAGGEPSDSAYLDIGIPIEPSSHPTVAETGLLATSPSEGPGPLSGQLKRNVGGAKREGEIISLGSFGGEGLKVKPPTSPPLGSPLGSIHDGASEAGH